MNLVLSMLFRMYIKVYDVTSIGFSKDINALAMPMRG